MYGSETWAEPSALMERFDCKERNLDGCLATFDLGRPADRLVQRVLRSLSSSSWKKSRGRKRKFWTEVVKEDLRTFSVDSQFRRDKLEKIGQSYVQGQQTSAKMRVIAAGDDISPPIKSNPNWERSPGHKRKFWSEEVKEDLRTLGVDRQFSRDVKFRRLWNSDGWVDSMRTLAEDRTG
ncbi:hypothetical protein RB195_018036 [Necator americanus]|uniref:Uncharacterized protein n=1 Tax=Necator americanus TaxID=51031 RepID=A0ABR1CAA3_NECAM